MAKTIITASLTGTATQSPNLPMTPKAIAEDAIACWRAGAAIVHLHMRDDRGFGTMDKERFREAQQRIRDNCDVVINMTTSGEFDLKNNSEERRMEHILELHPEMASFDAGSINVVNGDIFDNTTTFLKKLGAVMLREGIKPEVEIMDLGMMAATDYYRSEGVLTDPVHYQFVLGFFSGAPATVDNLVYMKNYLPKDATWSAFGIGKAHLPILYTTLALGGHIRVGLEDNIYYRKGEYATNEQLVSRAARLIREFNNEPATPDEARVILKLRRDKHGAI